MLVLLALLFSFCAFAAAELDDFDKAEQLLQTNPLAAEAMFSAMVLKNKDNVIALFGLGQARYSLKKYYDCQSTMESVIFFAKDNAELKSLIAQAWGLLAQCQYAVQDAVACTKSCQESLIRDSSSFDVRFLHAKCQLQKGDLEQFAKSMCAPTKFALLHNCRRFDVFHLLLLAWASVSENTNQANEFAVKCDTECNEGDRTAYDQLRPFLRDSDKHPNPRIVANRKALSSANALEYHKLLKMLCLPYLKPVEDFSEL